MPSRTVIKRLTNSPDYLSIDWDDGSASEFASVWLRDNVPEDRDAHNGQRLIDLADLPPRPRIRAATAEPGAVRIDWEDETRGARFELEWLAAHAAARRLPELAVRTWRDGATLVAERDFAWVRLAEARASPPLRLAWLTRLLQDGIAFLSGVPAQPGALLEAMPLLGRVLETNYGLVFDVRSVPQPENLAYSDLGLGLHTDNPYRDPVPGFQALHALLPSSEGGDSLFADGYALAQQLRAEDPAAFARLATTAVPFHYRSAEAELYAERPLIQLSVRGEIAAVHYNSRSIAPLNLRAREAVEFYGPYRRFAQLLRAAQYQLKMRLGAETVVVFDNQRILHGRTAFSSSRQPRHLRGCYLSRDSVLSETALLRRRLADLAAPA
jgi:alpha-ketoglutarate-dependent taurine dioxygenase